MDANQSGELAQAPVFVCGVGRSGTSLLQSMLNAHPEICIPPETHFFRRYLARPRIRKRLESQGAKPFVDRLRNDEDFARVNCDAAELLSEFVADGRPFDLRAVYEQMLLRYAGREGKSRVGDKDPRLVDYLPEASRLFPEATVLHIIRDPRDVLLSRMKAAWSASRPWWLHVMIYAAQLRRGRRHGKRYFGNRYFEVCYEELIQQPETALRSVCDHVQVDFRKEMLDFSQSAKRLVDQRELSWKRETMGPLLSANFDKWKTELSPTQVQVTELLCRETFHEFGYRPAGSEPSTSWGLRGALCFSPLLRAMNHWSYPLWLSLRG